MVKAIWSDETFAYVWNDFGILKKIIKTICFNRNGTPYYNCIIEVDLIDFGKKEIAVILYKKHYESEPDFFINESRISVNFHWRITRSEIIDLREVKISMPAFDFELAGLERGASYVEPENLEQTKLIEITEEVMKITLNTLEENAKLLRLLND